jgi:putative hydrolase
MGGSQWPDLNATIATLLRDLAAIQSVRPKSFGYKRAASAVFWLERPIDELRAADGSFPRIPGLGPSSMRVVAEVVETGWSASAERAIDASGKRAEVDRRRAIGGASLSRAGTLRVLALRDRRLPALARYRGDLQMHSEWSDGTTSILAMARGCEARGYEWCAMTDHAGGLAIARGLSDRDLVRQTAAIARVNEKVAPFRVLRGIEANIAADGSLDLTPEQIQSFDIVVAAPHSKLRSPEDQTARLLRAIRTRGVHVIGHPRGRMIGSRPGIIADWDAVFAAAAQRNVAIELDGDPARQDLDYQLAARARDAGCLFAADSDAHAPDQLLYAETALAHARLARIPPERLVNTWPLAKLLRWAAGCRQ